MAEQNNNPYKNLPMSLEKMAEDCNMHPHDMQYHLIAVGVDVILKRAKKLAPARTDLRLNGQYFIQALKETF